MLHSPAGAAARAFASLALLAAAALAQTPPTIGNLLVVRIGDGLAPLSSASTATFVDEYTTAGTLVQSIALPTAASGAQQPLTNSGTATSEGFLNLSPNGLWLTLAGYATPPGLPNVASTASASTPRVVARMDLAGLFDTSTTLPDGYTTTPTSTASGNIRAAVTVDGSGFWTSGTGNGTSAGVRFVAFGASSSIGLNAGSPSNVRVVGTAFGQLYATSASGVTQGVATVGTGLPTAPGQPVALLPGFPTTSGPSAYDFWFADPATLYVADDRGVASGGGIQKWALAGGVWTLQYTLAGASGCRGLTGWRQNGTTTLWATTANNQLVTVVDAGVASPVTSIATAAPNTALRGLRYLPRPSTLLRFPAACGQATIDARGNGQIGTDVVTTIQGAVGVPFVGYGLTTLGVPLCGCTVLHEFSFVAAGAQHTLSLPNDPALFGFALWIQGLDFLAPGGCATLPFALTDGFSLTIQ